MTFKSNSKIELIHIYLSRYNAMLSYAMYNILFDLYFIEQNFIDSKMREE